MGALVVLAAEAGVVEPGAEAETVVLVANTGPAAERFDVSVEGPAAGWARVEPGQLALGPGEEAAVSVRFRPPRSPETAPGARSYAVVVVAHHDAGLRGRAAGAVEVASFTAVSASLFQARDRRGRPQVALVVRNIGNRPVDAAVAAEVEPAGPPVTATPAAVQLAPGGSAQVALECQPAKGLRRRRGNRLVVSLVGADGVLAELAADRPEDGSLGDDLRRTARALAVSLVVLLAGGIAALRVEPDAGPPATGPTSTAGGTEAAPEPGPGPAVPDPGPAREGGPEPGPVLGGPLAFARSYGAGDEDIVLRGDGGAAGWGELRLRADGARETRPRLAPGGGFVAFLREADGAWQVCVVRATGGETVCVADADPSTSVAWSPDGATLYLSRAGGLHSVPYDAENGLVGDEIDLGIAVPTGAFALSPGGDRVALADAAALVVATVAVAGDDAAAPTRIDLPDPPAGPPAWSPDGHHLVFAAGGHVHTVPAAGGQARRLTPDGTEGREPAWAPGGGWVVFAGARGGAAGLFALAVPPDGSPAAEPVRLTAPTGRDSTPSF